MRPISTLSNDHPAVFARGLGATHEEDRWTPADGPFGGPQRIWLGRDFYRADGTYVTSSMRAAGNPVPG